VSLRIPLLRDEATWEEHDSALLSVRSWQYAENQQLTTETRNAERETQNNVRTSSKTKKKSKIVEKKCDFSFNLLPPYPINKSKTPKSRIMKTTTATEPANAIREITDSLHRLEQQLRKSFTLSLEWLEAKDVCDILNIPRSTLVSYSKKGEIPFGKFGARYFYRLSDINHFLSSQTTRKR